MIHRHLQALSLSLALLGSAACLPELWPEPGPSPPTRKAGVYVKRAADSVEVGDAVMFNYEIVPPKGEAVSSSVKVDWESSDTSVATVVNGWVFGKKVGVAAIWATANGAWTNLTDTKSVRASARVTVTPKTQSPQ